MSYKQSNAGKEYCHTEPPVESNGSPKAGFEWGEVTQQAREHAPAYFKTDAEEIRACFGIPEFDPSSFDYTPYVDVVTHEVDPEVGASNKGTDCLIHADRDAGKSTFARQLCQRLMEQNDERVIWAASPERSEWLPLKYWSTLWLPENAKVEATWMLETSDSNQDIEDLETVVRDVYRYSDPVDLLEQIYDEPPGSLHIVYPDPSFTRCEELTRQTNRISGTLPFRTDTEARDETSTPVSHWWIALWLARTEVVTGDFMSLIFDEAHRLFKMRAKNDDQRLYDKIDLVRSLWEESRRARFSPYMFLQDEDDFHEMIQKRFKWRIHLADGSPNPNMQSRSTIPNGFSEVPMAYDFMKKQPTGRGLCYTESEFSGFSWEDIPDWREDKHRWLKIKLQPQGLSAGTTASEASTTPERMQFDANVFSEWENQVAHRLYVNDPGSGWIDVTTGRVAEDLESPFDELYFEDPVERDGSVEYRMQSGDGDSKTVAVIPLSEGRSAEVSR